MANTHGVPLHHRSPLLRDEDTGTILAWQTRYLGIIKYFFFIHFLKAWMFCFVLSIFFAALDPTLGY